MSRPRDTLVTHTQERVDAILAAWRDGASYGAIAKRLDLEKNVVAGIVYRNKETGQMGQRAFRPPGWGPGPAPKRLEHHSGGHMPTGRTVVGTHKMASGARYRECQWIAGEPSADDRCKCGGATGANRVYCPAHEDRARRPVQAREAGEAA